MSNFEAKLIILVAAIIIWQLVRHEGRGIK